jgi:DNA-directed RNA polymerase subunit RPC12/RpoP
MSDQSKLSYSVTCADCGSSLKSEDHTNTFAFVAYAREQGWDVPPITENRQIRCPKCQSKT